MQEGGTEHQDKCRNPGPYQHVFNFSQLLLLCIDVMQGNPEGSIGVSFDDMLSFFAKNYVIDGDLKSQIETALQQAWINGFVKKTRKRYVLRAPVSKIHLLPPGDECNRQQVYKFVDKIFAFDCPRERNKSSCIGGYKITKKYRDACVPRKKICREKKL